MLVFIRRIHGIESLDDGKPFRRALPIVGDGWGAWEGDGCHIGNPCFDNLYRHVSILY